MDLKIDDRPVQVIPRRRLIRFDLIELAHALRAQCRAEGILISEDCELSIFGLVAGTSPTLVIDGD